MDFWNPTDLCWEYDSQVNNWEQSVYLTLTQPKSELASTRVNVTHVYVSGGTPDKGTNTLAVADWIIGTSDVDKYVTPAPSLVNPRRQHCVVRIDDDRFMEVTGLPYTNEVHIHNLRLGSTIKVANLPAPNRYASFCGTIRDINSNPTHVVVAGGSIEPGGSTDQVDMFDLSTYQWVAPSGGNKGGGPNMPLSPYHGSSMDYGRTFACIDGINVPEKVYYLHPDNMEWVTSVANLYYDHWQGVALMVPDEFLPCTGEVKKK